MLKIRLFIVFAAAAVFALAGGPDVSAQGGLKGKVRNERGGGIANANITVRLDGKDLRSVKADTKGNFTIEGLRAGKYNVVFDADGYSSGVLYDVEVRNRGVRDLGDRLILSVDRGSQVIVNGSVFYKDGTSLAGAKIEIEEVRADGSTKKLGTGTTSQTGEFTFRRPPGTAKLRVTAKHKGVSGTKEVEVESPAIYRLAIELPLEREKDQ